MMRNRALITTAIGFLLLCLTTAVGPSRAEGMDQARLALKGYDPVAYFTMGRPVPGKPDLASRLPVFALFISAIFILI